MSWEKVNIPTLVSTRRRVGVLAAADDGESGFMRGGESERKRETVCTRCGREKENGRIDCGNDGRDGGESIIPR